METFPEYDIGKFLESVQLEFGELEHCIPV